ncbi:MAG: bifunctional phosphoribosyl-AMP cyclohydrolase/phosphoribosyl-ATP diphosphatase HisIE [Ignavibacteria bacterium]|nr:bifunctional phosphoribosyl-AMP cyclohydrolase/phosphoribosyl-ATP diphosphatase HisIE [Ignavibacteria bacterium]
MINIDKLNFSKLNGMIPAIIIDSVTEKVLMLGFMNREALEKTIELKKVTFFSRTKQRLWTKGETSNNYLHVKDIKVDCDSDSLLIYAQPDGPTCHMGNYSCFGIQKDRDIKWLSGLFNLISERKKSLPENSYTTKLFKSGGNRIIQKVGEEAVETIIAAKNEDKEEIINETSDLIFHLFVMLNYLDIDLSEIVKNLEKRHK